MKIRTTILLSLLLLTGWASAATSKDCIILGDSIAVGIAQQIAAEGISQCEVTAKVGRPTAEVLQSAPVTIQARNVVISTGSNDWNPRSTYFSNLRSRIYGAVVWILPAKQSVAREIITKIAAEHGDRVIDLVGLPLADGIHPTRGGYQRVANTLKSEFRRPISAGDGGPLVLFSLALSNMARR